MAGAVLAVGALVLSSATSSAAVPTSRPPVLQKNSRVATADALATAQIEGIVWKQAIAGDTVFAGGQFDSARPAGAARGTQSVPRANLMSYDIRTGAMTRFAPELNGAVRALAVSADDKTLYVGGDFTKVGDESRPYFAAFDIESGSLEDLTLPLNQRVNAILAMGKNVYLGGWFTRIGTYPRQRLASFTATDGRLTGWKPAADRSVEALVGTPDGSRVVIGGSFSTLNGESNPGMGAVTQGIGSLRPWKINTEIKNYGPDAAILDLAVDEDTVYGATYGYDSGNFEGVFAAEPADGTTKWLQACHGDQYGVAPIGDLVYSVGHAHYCKDVGAFGEVTPQRTLVVTKDARGTVAHNSQAGVNYYDWAGYEAPSIYNWFPRLNTGLVSGSNQGAWSIEATDKYVVLGGEFTRVNGKPQQGLVRFTTAANGAPSAMGPMGSVAGLTPTVEQGEDGVSRVVSWNANYDLDDTKLYYDVLRDGEVIASFMRKSTFYSRGTVSYADTAAAADTRYNYQVRVSDFDGNSVTSVEVRG